MTTRTKSGTSFDPFLAASFKNRDNTYLVRGTPEWDLREWEREKAGCTMLSYGTIYESEQSGGYSSRPRMRDSYSSRRI